MERVSLPGDAPLPPGKRLAFILILCLGVIVAAAGILGLLEGVTRVFAREAEQGRFPIEPDDLLHHRWQAGREFNDVYISTPYMLYINRQHWVSRHDISQEKPAGVFRIFYLGDSAVQGVVDTDKKMCTLVERKLNGLFARERHRFEVVNTGTSSYSIMQYYLLAKYVIQKYSPDLVVIVVEMNDVPGDSFYKQFAKFDSAGDPIAILPNREESKKYYLTPHGTVERPFADRLRESLLSHSALLRLVAARIGRRGTHGVALEMQDGPGFDGPANWLAPEWSAEIQGNVDYSMSLLGKTIDLLSENHIRVMVTGVPYHHQYAGGSSSRPHDVLEKTALSHGAAYLNSFEALRGQITGSPQPQYYWPNDPTHFGETGNAIWAEAQVSFMLDNREALLPSP